MRQALASGLRQQAAIGVDQALRPIGRRQWQHAAMPTGPARHLARAQRPDEVAAENGLQPRQAGAAAPAPARESRPQAGQEAGRWRAGSARLRLGCRRLPGIDRQFRGQTGSRLGGRLLDCGVGQRPIGRVGCGVRLGTGRQVAARRCGGHGFGLQRRSKVSGGGKRGRRLAAVGIGRGEPGRRLVCGWQGAVGRRPWRRRRRLVGVGRQLDQHLRPVVMGRGRRAGRRRVFAEQVVGLVLHRQPRGWFGRGGLGGTGRVGRGHRFGPVCQVSLGGRVGLCRRHSGRGLIGGLGCEGNAIGARLQAGQRGGRWVQQILHRRQSRRGG